MDVCDLELLNIDFVFAYQFPKSASLFLRCTGSLGNISLVSEQKALQVVCLELGDYVFLHFAERQLDQVVMLA